MKIALVHELLTMRGGAERVLRVLAEMFPDAPIHTLLYKEELFREWLPAERVIVSKLQNSIFNSQFSISRFNHHLFLNRFPKAVEAWDFFDYDLVISSSSAFAHGIITNGKPKHISYIHSPARYLWDRTHDVLARANPLQRMYLERTFHRLRIWDAEAARRADVLLAASTEVQRRIELYWRRESEIVYPPVDDFWFQEETSRPLPGEARRAESGQDLKTSGDYYLIISTLVPYKRIDLAIEACNRLQLPLQITGEGPHRRALEKLAGPTVKFLGYTDSATVKKLYAGAKAVIFPGYEDFGLVPLEAAAAGTPTIAYRGGGALETIIEGTTGEFFDEPNVDSLVAALRKFEQKKYSEEAAREQAEGFRRKHFETGIRAAINRL